MIRPLEDDIVGLQDFDQTTLLEMDSVKLMNRTDTKFVFRRSLLAELLAQLQTDFKVLNIEGNLVSSYKTLYFDTECFQFFLDHHNGKGNRYKVRIRNYVESNLYFLEIKNKYKERTVKSRIGVSDFEMEFSAKSAAYVNSVIPNCEPLAAKLWNGFNRITLVNKVQKERLTLDLGLSFEWEAKKISYDHILVAELKQENVNRSSLFYNLMKTSGVRPSGMSKYCVGALGIYPNLKYNNFKEKIRLIDKLG